MKVKLMQIFPWLAIIGVLTVFSVNSLAHSGRKAFWRDEAHALQQFPKYKFPRIFWTGPPQEGSASPLDYLIMYAVYQLRQPLHYLSLQPHQYLRIHHLVALWLAVLFVYWKINRRINLSEILAFLAAVGFFLFNSTIYYYSSEMRMYSLWASLSFIWLFLHRFRRQLPVAWFIVILAAAATTTASTFQIVVFSAAVVITEILKQKRLIPQIPFSWLMPIFITLLINLNFLIQSPKYSYPPPAWIQFFNFWQQSLPAIISAAVLVIFHYRRRHWDRLEALLTASGWLLIGPVSFFLIRKGGLFFDPRQYVYYPAAYAYIIYEAASAIFFLLINFRKVPVYLYLTACLFIVSIWRQTDLSLPLQSVRFLILGQPISLPVNYSLLSPNVPGSIPQNYEFQEIDQYRLDNKAARTNFDVWWEYMLARYPPESFPRDPSAILVARARDFSFELVEIQKKL